MTNNKKRYLFLIVTLLLLFTWQGVSADILSINRDSVNRDKVIPSDPQLVKSTLSNGLTYYVRENRKPENRIILRLVVNAGSVLENENQRGLAHFLEHMAFNGTRNFPGNTLVDLLEREGVKFGPDLNAYTGYDNTVYMLDIPADREELLDSALLILFDWASGITFSPEEIEKERGVVIEEWRKNKGSSERISEIQRSEIFAGSRYAERQPIGTIEVLENFTREDLVSFYTDWYRPDLMAVIAVGDFDKSEVEKKITDTFSAMPLQKLRKMRPEYPVPGRDKTQVSIVRDEEATSAELKVIYFHENIKQETIGDYRDNLVSSLYFSMLNSRYNEKRQQKDPPFLSAGAGYGKLTSQRSVFTAVCTADPDDVDAGINALAGELSRIRRDGFTDTELRRAKDKYAAVMVQLFREADNTISEALASELTRNYFDNEYVPGIEKEYTLAMNLLPGITIEEVNLLSDYFFTGKEPLILLSLPESGGGGKLDKEHVKNVFEKALVSRTSPYVDFSGEGDLVSELPEPGSSMLVKTDKHNNIDYYTLSNGAKVIIKKTDFREDEVLFTAFSLGGHSVVHDDDWISANFAAGIVSRGILGTRTRIQLDKYLDDKLVNVSPYIGETSEGFSGSSSLTDLETLFQMVYLFFTSAEKERDSFDSYLSRLGIYLQNQEADPNVIFGRTLRKILTSGHPRGRPFDSSVISEIDIDKAYSVFSNRFSSPGDFTWIFTGSAGPDVIIPFAEKYLAFTIPDKSSADERWKDTGIRLPEEKVEKTIYMGKEEKADVALVFSGDFNWSRENLVLLTALTEAADVRLREVIREDEGGTYSINVYPSVDKYPVSQYQITVYFACSPQRSDELKALAFRELHSIAEEVPEGTLQKFKNSSKLEYRKQIKENSFWLSAIKDSEFDNSGLAWLDHYEEMADNITKQMIMDAASVYFNPDRMVDVTMLPEK
ncbi:MAG: insulinase family protein [Spirochaetia bacterium]|jgi:zinc protease|nr:insulinase family protein [Spirochaetia bacterium]